MSGPAIGMALAVWLGFVLVVTTGLGIYAALWWALKPDAPWTVKLVYRLGQTALIWAAFVVVTGLATATVWGLRLAVMGH